MTTTEKLEALVRKAAKSGWQKGWDWLDTIISDDAPEFTCKLFLFNHDFARALFGSKIGNYLNEVLGEVVDPEWKYHLQQAVISNDPIEYMYKAVFDGEK